MTNDKNLPQNKAPRDGEFGIVTLIQSTLWAALGVQKEQNRVRDFTHGNPWHFVLMGVGFTVFFVGGLIGLVQIVLAT